MKNKKLKIVYEDKHIIVVNKPPKLLTVSTLKEKEATLYHEVRLYLKRKNKNNKVFIVHRLDYDTSGLVLFAKDIETKNYFQENWDKVIRRYMGIVVGKTKDKDTLKNYLMETKTNLVYVVPDKNGKLAITTYSKVKENNNYTLLDIDIKTGRKNQIRVQFNHAGFPILGDKKYNPKGPNSDRMYLHAYYLEFINPKTKETIKLELDVPNEFLKIIK